MPIPTASDLLDNFKSHARIEHTRDDDYIEEVILPAAIEKVIETTSMTDGTDDEDGEPTNDDWDTKGALATMVVFRIAAAMYESREVNINIQPSNAELTALWRPYA